MSEVLDKKEKLVPELRFKEFEEEWLNRELSDITKINQGLQIAISQRLTEPMEGAYFYITNEFLREGSKSRYYILNPPDSVKCIKSDLLMTRTGNTGQVVTGVEGAFHNNFFKIKLINGDNSKFLFYFLTSHHTQHIILKLAGTSTIPDLNHSDFYKININLPSLPEQQKIADFLSAVDQKIQHLQRKKELLTQYKKGMMQKLFSQEIRFKDEQGNDFPEWEEKKLGEVFERVKRKNKENNQNVLTISAQQGLVNQIEYFNHSVSAKDLTGYYLLKKGEFAYNKSYSKGFPMGAIKRLDKYDKGVVSTLYICFRIIENDDSTFYKEFLDGGGINHEIHKIAQEGARNHGLLNMSVVEFFKDIVIPRPSVEEQTKIGQFLNALSAKVVLAKLELEQSQRFKKGLLQKMFV